jgi:hypothetical protein
MDVLKIAPKKRMTTYTLVNATSMLAMIEENRLSDLQDLLESFHTESSRKLVLSEKEVLNTLSRCIDSTAESKDELNDKLTRIFWNAGGMTLLKSGVI